MSTKGEAMTIDTSMTDAALRRVISDPVRYGVGQRLDADRILQDRKAAGVRKDWTDRLTLRMLGENVTLDRGQWFSLRDELREDSELRARIDCLLLNH